MKQGDLLFVYGTLRRGQSADLAKGGRVDYIGEDDINGDLYDLGAFPGAKVTNYENFDVNLPTISGEVFRIRNASMTSILDAYEGYPTMYNRLMVEGRSGHLMWVYTYNYEVTEAQRIPHGDWVTRVPLRMRA